VPRTKLLSRLAVLAQAQRHARAAGIDVPELLGRREEVLASDAGLSRREVLKRAAIAGAGLTVAGRAVLDPQSAFGRGFDHGHHGQPRIAIVGAGISGMTAAMTLKDAGFSNVTVYEASDHVGGRTYTRKDDGFWEPGQWAEWGGELVDSAHDLMFSLCDRFGFGTLDLETVTSPGSNDILYFGDRYYRWDDMVRDWNHGHMDDVVAADMANLPDFPWAYNDPNWTPAGIALDYMSVYDWIETRVPGGHHSRLGQFIDVAYNIEYGEETRRQGATDLLGLLGFPTGDPFWIYAASDERYKIVGGNQQISLAQADYLGDDNIRFGWSLTSLKTNRDGSVSATFGVGSGHPQTVTADQIILAVPLGVMKKLKAAGAFSQAFGDDQLKMGLIDALGFGADNKLQLQISDRFWTQRGPWGNSDGETYADTGFQEAWHVTAGQPGRTGIINNYTGGDTSRLLNPSKPFSDTSDSNPAVRGFVQNAARTFLSQIEPVFPGMTRKWTGKAQLSVWHVSPFHYGAYAYWTPGYMHRYSTYEAVPVGPVHFAGEHTSSNFQGYMEGAAEEGQRAANEIVDAYH
jgi:monoamine oxidase